MQNSIELSHVSKTFHADGYSTPVLHDITTRFALGALTMIVGASGCGKTTLISIISGMLSVSKGSVEVLGACLTSLSDKEKVLFRRNHIGFVFQQYNLLPALRAVENVALPLIIAGKSKKESLVQASIVLETMDMAPYEDQFPRQLSGGQQQRVAIARALVHNPSFVICDEPTAALDANMGLQVMNILRKAANNPSRGVLIVTHDNRIFHFADRILEMSDGYIVGDYKASDFLQKEKGALCVQKQ